MRSSETQRKTQQSPSFYIQKVSKGFVDLDILFYNAHRYVWERFLSMALSSSVPLPAAAREPGKGPRPVRRAPAS